MRPPRPLKAGGSSSRRVRHFVCAGVALFLLLSLWTGSSKLPDRSSALEFVKRRLTAPVDGFGRSAADRDLELSGALALLLHASALSPAAVLPGLSPTIVEEELEALASAATVLDAAEAKQVLLSRVTDFKASLFASRDVNTVGVWDLAPLVVLAGKRAQPALTVVEEKTLRPVFTQALLVIRGRLNGEGLYGVAGKAGFTARTIHQAQAIAALRAAAATPALGAGALLLDELDLPGDGIGDAINDPLDWGVLAAKALDALTRRMLVPQGGESSQKQQQKSETPKRAGAKGKQTGTSVVMEDENAQDPREEDSYDDDDDVPVYVGVQVKPGTPAPTVKPVRGLSSEQCLLLYFLEPGDVPTHVVAALADACVSRLATPFGVRMGRVFPFQAHQLAQSKLSAAGVTDALLSRDGGHVCPLEQAMLLVGAAKHAASLVGLGLEARDAAGQLALRLGAARRPEFDALARAKGAAEGGARPDDEARQLLAVMAELQGAATNAQAAAAAAVTQGEEAAQVPSTELARTAALASLRSLVSATLYVLPVLQRLDEERLRRSRGRAGHTAALTKEALKTLSDSGAQNGRPAGVAQPLTATDPHNQRLQPRPLPVSGLSAASVDAASSPELVLSVFDAVDGDAAETAALLALPRVQESVAALLQGGVDGPPPPPPRTQAQPTGAGGTGRRAAKKAAAAAASGWPSFSVGVRALTVAFEWSHALSYPETLCELPADGETAGNAVEGAPTVRLLEAWAASRRPILPGWSLSPAWALSPALSLAGTGAAATAARGGAGGALAATGFTVDATVLTRRSEQLGDAAGGAVAFFKSKIKGDKASGSDKAGGGGGGGVHNHHTRAPDDTSPRVHLFYPDTGLPLVRAGGLTRAGVSLWAGDLPTMQQGPGGAATPPPARVGGSRAAPKANASSVHTHGTVARYASPELEYPVVRLQVSLDDEEEGDGSSPAPQPASYGKRLRRKAGEAAAALSKGLSGGVKRVASIWMDLRSRLQTKGGDATSGQGTDPQGASEALPPHTTIVDVSGDGQPSSLGTLAALRMLQRWAAAGETTHQAVQSAQAGEAARAAQAAEAQLLAAMDALHTNSQDEAAAAEASSSSSRHMMRILTRLTRGVARGRAATKSAWSKATDWGARLVRTLFVGLPDRPEEDTLLAAAIVGAKAAVAGAPASAVSLADHYWAPKEVLDVVAARYKEEVEAGAGRPGGARLPVLQQAGAGGEDKAAGGGSDGAAAAEERRARAEQRRAALLQPNELPAAPAADAAEVEGGAVQGGEARAPRAVPVPLPAAVRAVDRAGGAAADAQDDDSSSEEDAGAAAGLDAAALAPVQPPAVNLRTLAKRLGCDANATKAGPQPLLPPWHSVCCPYVVASLSSVAAGAEAYAALPEVPIFYCSGATAGAAGVQPLAVSCAAVNDDFCDCGPAAGPGGAGVDETATGACSGVGGVFKCQSGIALAVSSGALVRPGGSNVKPVPSSWPALLAAPASDLASWGYVPVEKVGDGVADCSDASDEAARE